MRTGSEPTPTNRRSEGRTDSPSALAKKDAAAQTKAVANLQWYTVEHGKLLGGATGLPPKAVQADLLQHVLELKAQLDAFAKKQYAGGGPVPRPPTCPRTQIAKQKDLPN